MRDGGNLQSHHSNNYHSTFFSVLCHFHTIYRQKFINFFFNKKSSPLFFILSFFSFADLFPQIIFSFLVFFIFLFYYFSFFLFISFFSIHYKMYFIFCAGQNKKNIYKLYVRKRKRNGDFFFEFSSFFSLLHSRF